MAFKLQPQASETLVYFDKYDYPLTKEELIFWSTRPLKLPNQEYFYLPGRSKLVSIRKKREKISKAKWKLAYGYGEQLKKIPFIKAVYVTGSLAMNNADVNDDVDLMLITAVNTLWITRGLINIFFWAKRRMPGQKQAPDKLCINLWLDESALHITSHDLYRAHEVLQAKLIWDRNNTGKRFLAANAWVKKFLPNAYSDLDQLEIRSIRNYWLWPINFLFFIGQWLYMKPKMTTERVSLHSAFFHPTKASVII